MTQDSPWLTAVKDGVLDLSLQVRAGWSVGGGREGVRE